MEKRLKIADIQVGDRHRKSFGDLKGLAHSIKTVGLLQAIGVTKNGNKLVFGERRLRATTMNGDNEIDCRILDIDDLLEAEHAENEFRQALTLSEKHALAQELMRAAKEKEGERRGNPTGSNQHARKERQNGTNSRQDHSRRTRARAAVNAGFSSEQEMRRVEKVMKKGVPELQEAMDKGHIPVSAAAELSERAQEEQVAVLEEHRSENGQIKIPRTAKSKAVLLAEEFQGIMERIWGIKEKYKTVKGMMDSPEWLTSSDEEKLHCVVTVKNAAKVLLEFSQDMVKYRTSNL